MKRIINLSGVIARTILGAVFVFSGLVKAIDPLGTVYKIEDYLKAFGGFMTDLMPLAGVAAFALIALEFILGVCLLGNVKTQWTKWLALAFMLVMTPLTLWIALTNPVSDCGCFGDAIVLSNWQTFWKNIVLLVLLALLFVQEYMQPSKQHSWKIDVSVVSAGLLLVIALMVWTLYHLPLRDFRPYKIGNNIPELMEIPEGAPEDEYEITFVYAKDGVEQEFTLDNYPKGDPEWTFVDQKSKLVKKGFEAPIHDFELLTVDEYDDLTYTLLESEEPVTLIVMYDLVKADVSQMDKVRKMLEQPDCYALTGSGEDMIESFCEEHNLPMESFLLCDPVTLKTIVRANPGVMVVENGTITDKWNVRNRK